MKKTSILYPFVAIALCAFTFGCQSEKTSESVIDLEATAREPKPFTQSDLPALHIRRASGSRCAAGLHRQAMYLVCRLQDKKPDSD